MDNVVEYNRRGAITSASVGSGGGGGGVDDIFRRLGNVETGVSEVRTQVSAILAIIPHLATAVSVSEVKSQIGGISTIIPHLATKADLMEVKTELASMETKIIKWIIATVLTTATLAFSIAKFVH